MKRYWNKPLEPAWNGANGICGSSQLAEEAFGPCFRAISRKILRDIKRMKRIERRTK